MIPHSRPTVPTTKEWSTLVAELEPGWVADGPLVRRFEAELAPWLGGIGGVAVNSGSNALQLALLAVGVRPGSKVLVPAYCCAALLNSIAAAGAQPLLVDAEPAGHNLSLEQAHANNSEDVSAVIVVHMFGDPVESGRFRSLGVPVIDDCAQSLGSRIKDQPVGSSGDAAIGSFFATKVITTGHGGIVTSPLPDTVARVRDLVEYDNREQWQPRFSYGFTELQALLGLWQLRHLDQFLLRRRMIADYYNECFSTHQMVTPSTAGTVGDGRIHYRYVLRARDADEAIPALRQEGIDAKRPVFRPLHHYLGQESPEAEQAHRQIVSLPIYPGLTDAEVERVVEAVIHRADLWLQRA